MTVTLTVIGFQLEFDLEKFNFSWRRLVGNNGQ